MCASEKLREFVDAFMRNVCGLSCDTLKGAVERPDVAKDIATMRKRKAKMMIILPDTKVKQTDSKALN
ncbi:hypothetical protein [Celeribacter sp.]|uniref:hypothetical protein n=1 Tax=Celeribacter sp. TaxID=1890673 RepID=UPI003A92BBBD